MLSKRFIGLRGMQTGEIFSGLALFFLTFVGFCLLFLSNYAFFGRSEQFSLLAQAFLSGNVGFSSASGPVWDASLYHYRMYWPLGPFPAILLVPFLLVFHAMHTQFFLAYLHLPLVLVVWWLVWKLCRLLKYRAIDAGWWATTFVFGSMFAGIAAKPNSWFFSHVVAVLLLLFALHEYFGVYRTWIIGSMMGLALATRGTVGLGILFFLSDIFLFRRKKVHDWAFLLLPILGAIFGLGWYNWVRFDTPFESGYRYQNLSLDALRIKRESGIFSLRHIPTNLYYSLLAMPEPVFRSGGTPTFPFLRPNAWGMSFLVTCPYVFLVFSRRRYWDTRVILLLGISASIAVSVWMYYGVGYAQYGYRYFLDFFPFLFTSLLLVMRSPNGRLSLAHVSFLGFSIVWNLSLVSSFLFF